MEGEAGGEEVEDAAEQARERALQVGDEAADVGEVGVALDERRVHHQRAAADERGQRVGHVQLHGEGAVGVGRRARHHPARAPQLHVRVCVPGQVAACMSMGVYISCGGGLGAPRTREGGGAGDVDEAAGVAGHDAGDDEPAQPAELGVRGADQARRSDGGGNQQEERLGRRHPIRSAGRSAHA